MNFEFTVAITVVALGILFHFLSSRMDKKIRKKNKEAIYRAAEKEGEKRASKGN